VLFRSYALGEVHQRLRQPRAAAENLEKAATLCPNPATQAAIYQKLWRLYTRLGEPEKAHLAQMRAARLGADRIAVQISEEA
jgi:tetratricopeptide (TPR) repeat protein